MHVISLDCSICYRQYINFTHQQIRIVKNWYSLGLSIEYSVVIWLVEWFVLDCLLLIIVVRFYLTCFLRIIKTNFAWANDGFHTIDLILNAYT